MNIVITAGMLPAVAVFGQVEAVDSNKVQTEKRIKTISISSGIVYASSLIGLNRLWYKDYEKSGFHTFNDSREWLQIDKVGHTYSTYNLTNLSYSIYTNGRDQLDKKALLYSSSGAFIFLSAIEVFDGYSSNWGFSWGDFTANTIGIALFTSQQLLLNEQIVRLKYSYQNTEYRKFRPGVLGENTLQAAFKDYNGQTYWASLNLNGVYKEVNPKWLNLAFGYGGTQMLYADKTAQEINHNPQREYYLSVDVDWEKIETKRKWLKWCFKVANCIKVPAPTIQWEKSGAPRYYFLFF